MNLEFRISPTPGSRQSQRTTYKFGVFVGGVMIWPVDGAEDPVLEIQIDDLLSYLTEYWKPLLLRQTYPYTLNPSRPSHLRSEALQKWAKEPLDVFAEQDEELENFQDCHDMSRCFAGYFDLPSLWIIRAGNVMFFDAHDRVHQIPFDSAVKALEAIGNDIAGKLRNTGDERWKALIAAWDMRNEGNAFDLLKWSTSLDGPSARVLTDEGLLQAPTTLKDAANDNNELRLAARMSSALPLDDIRQVLKLFSSFPKVEAPNLADLARQIEQPLQKTLANARPFEQGEAIANIVREKLGIKLDEMVDIFAIVEGLGIDIRILSLEIPTLDALAVWGSKHGPAAVLNCASDRHDSNAEPRKNGQMRITLAHELCHLLVDASHTLSAVDVLNSRMPAIVEQRARAFAAQFLLPSNVAGDLWVEAGHPRGREGLERLLDSLCKRFVVAKSVASWKLQHGARRHHVNLASMLDALVPGR